MTSRTPSSGRSKFIVATSTLRINVVRVTPVTDLPKGVSHMDKTIVEQHRQALELGVESRITTRDRLNGVDSEASKVPESVHHEQVEKFATSWKIKVSTSMFALPLTSW